MSVRWSDRWRSLRCLRGDCTQKIVVHISYKDRACIGTSPWCVAVEEAIDGVETEAVESSSRAGDPLLGKGVRISGCVKIHEVQPRDARKPTKVSTGKGCIAVRSRGLTREYRRTRTARQ